MGQLLSSLVTSRKQYWPRHSGSYFIASLFALLIAACVRNESTAAKPRQEAISWLSDGRSLAPRSVFVFDLHRALTGVKIVGDTPLDPAIAQIGKRESTTARRVRLELRPDVLWSDGKKLETSTFESLVRERITDGIERECSGTRSPLGGQLRHLFGVRCGAVSFPPTVFPAGEGAIAVQFATSVPDEDILAFLSSTRMRIGAATAVRSRVLGAYRWSDGGDRQRKYESASSISLPVIQVETVEKASQRYSAWHEGSADVVEGINGSWNIPPATTVQWIPTGRWISADATLGREVLAKLPASLVVNPSFAGEDPCREDRAFPLFAEDDGAHSERRAEALAQALSARVLLLKGAGEKPAKIRVAEISHEDAALHCEGSFRLAPRELVGAVAWGVGVSDRVSGLLGTPPSVAGVRFLPLNQ